MGSLDLSCREREFRYDSSTLFRQVVRVAMGAVCVAVIVVSGANVAASGASAVVAPLALGRGSTLSVVY